MWTDTTRAPVGVHAGAAGRPRGIGCRSGSGARRRSGGELMSGLVDRIMEYERKIGAHRAGCLTAPSLGRLEWYFDNYFRGQAVRTIETGCGASTIVFAEYAAHHTAYCYDDRAEPASSVAHAQKYPGFHADRVRWIFGPTQ